MSEGQGGLEREVSRGVAPVIFCLQATWFGECGGRMDSADLRKYCDCAKLMFVRLAISNWMTQVTRRRSA